MDPAILRYYGDSAFKEQLNSGWIKVITSNILFHAVTLRISCFAARSLLRSAGHIRYHSLQSHGHPLSPTITLSYSPTDVDIERCGTEPLSLDPP